MIRPVPENPPVILVAKCSGCRPGHEHEQAYYHYDEPRTHGVPWSLIRGRWYCPSCARFAPEREVA